MPHLEKKLNENIIYKGRIITVKNDTVVLENGKTAEREVVVHNGGVSVFVCRIFLKVVINEIYNFKEISIFKVFLFQITFHHINHW